MRKKAPFKAAVLTAAGLGLGLFLSACVRIAPPALSQTTEVTVTGSSSVSGHTAPAEPSGSSTEEAVSTAGTTALPPTTESGTAPVLTETLPADSRPAFEPSPSPAVSTGTAAATSTGAARRTQTAETTSKETASWWDILSGNKDKDDAATFSHPMQIGGVAHFDGYDTLFDPFRADVSVQQVFRGNQALQMVKDASPLNPPPKAGQEYLVAQVLVKITASKNSEVVDVSPYFFSLAREDGRMYGDVTLFRSVTPVLSAINVGETSIGYICFQVDKEDKNPYIVFLSRAHGGLWFKTWQDDATDTTLEDVKQSPYRPAVTLPLETTERK